MSETEAEEFRKAIYAFADRIKAKQLAYLDAAEVAKSAKKSWESEIQAEQDFIDSQRQSLPLFDEKPEATAEDPEPEAAPADGEEWRSLPVLHLLLSDEA